MKRRAIIPFLGILFFIPFLSACDYFDEKNYVKYEDFKVNCVAIDTSRSSTNLYEVTVENTGDSYLTYYSTHNNDVYGEILRNNEPFSNADIIVSPGEKTQFYYELPKNRDINYFKENQFAFLKKDEKVKIDGQYHLTLANGYENYVYVYAECKLTGIDKDYIYEYYVNVSYQGKEYNTRCVYYEDDGIRFDINPNTNIDDISINSVIAFKNGERNSLSSVYRKAILLVLAIVFTPILILIGIKIVIVSIAVIAQKISEKRETKQDSNNSNNS